MHFIFKISSVFFLSPNFWKLLIVIIWLTVQHLVVAREPDSALGYMEGISSFEAGIMVGLWVLADYLGCSARGFAGCFLVDVQVSDDFAVLTYK